MAVGNAAGLIRAWYSVAIGDNQSDISFVVSTVQWPVWVRLRAAVRFTHIRTPSIPGANFFGMRHGTPWSNPNFHMRSRSRRANTTFARVTPNSYRAKRGRDDWRWRGCQV